MVREYRKATEQEISEMESRVNPFLDRLLELPTDQRQHGRSARRVLENQIELVMQDMHLKATSHGIKKILTT